MRYVYGAMRVTQGRQALPFGNKGDKVSMRSPVRPRPVPGRLCGRAFPQRYRSIRTLRRYAAAMMSQQPSTPNAERSTIRSLSMYMSHLPAE